ncbi:MAG TPA: hypothetical protein VIK28_09670, partial [Sedimentisphaerales bacterium]
RDEVLALCQQHGLSEHEQEVALMILEGRAAAPLQNFSLAIRQLVAEVTDRIRERNGEFKGAIEPGRY